MRKRTEFYKMREEYRKMKKYLRKSVFATAFAPILVLFAACAPKYVCEIPAEEPMASGAEKTEDVKTIGEREYALVLRESDVSSVTGRTVDVYDVMRPDIDLTLFYQGTVKLDRETEYVISFSNISPSPYASLGDISDLREEEIKGAVETVLAEDYDFSAYNEFVRTKAAIGSVKDMTVEIVSAM